MICLGCRAGSCRAPLVDQLIQNVRGLRGVAVFAGTVCPSPFLKRKSALSVFQERVTRLGLETPDHNQPNRASGRFRTYPS